jgi:hypothetical protein
MDAPNIAARIEQSRDDAGLRIEPGGIWPLEPIAPSTAQSEVRQFGGPGMLLCNDVINFVLVKTGNLGDQTIFAPAAGPLPDESGGRLGH